MYSQWGELEKPVSEAVALANKKDDEKIKVLERALGYRCTVICSLKMQEIAELKQMIEERLKALERVFTDHDCIHIADVIDVWSSENGGAPYPLKNYISFAMQVEEEAEDPKYETQIRDKYRPKFQALVKVNLLSESETREKYYTQNPLLKDYYDRTGIFNPELRRKEKAGYKTIASLSFCLLVASIFNSTEAYGSNAITLIGATTADSKWNHSYRTTDHNLRDATLSYSATDLRDAAVVINPEWSNPKIAAIASDTESYPIVRFDMPGIASKIAAIASDTEPYPIVRFDMLGIDSKSAWNPTATNEYLQEMGVQEIDIDDYLDDFEIEFPKVISFDVLDGGKTE